MSRTTRPTRPINPLIAFLTDALALHVGQSARLQTAIDALRALDEPIRPASPQRARGASGGHRPKRKFSAAAKRRMSAGMRRFWKARKAAAAANAVKLAQKKATPKATSQKAAS